MTRIILEGCSSSVPIRAIGGQSYQGAGNLRVGRRSGNLLLAALVMAFTFAGFAGMLQAGPGPSATFDAAGMLREWSFHNGPEFPGATGQIRWDGTEGHHRSGSLALHYSFAGGGNYVQAIWKVPDGGTDAGGMRLWLKKPHAHQVTFRVVDSAGQTFQKNVDYAYAGWQQIEVSFHAWDNSWGGPADGQCRPPIEQFGVLIENTAEPREGVLWIDDVESIAAAEQPPPATYRATDFVRGPGWHAGGGAGNKLADGIWQFAFNPGSTPSLNTDFSLLGKPASLRLVLDSEHSGTEIHLVLRSHFQTFYRQAGTLSGGPQVIEVPLGDMTTWKHRDGQNDGQVRLPLRLAQIHLGRGSGLAQGSIALQHIEVDTLLPTGQDVLLIPDAHLEDGQARFRVEVVNVRPATATGDLIVDIASVGGLVRREQTQVTVPGGGTSLIREFIAPVGDHSMLDATFNWLSPGAAAQPASVGLSLPIEEPGSTQLQPDSPIGMGLYLYRWNGNPRARERMAQIADLASRAGIRWTREEFQWHQIEPEPGRFDFSFYDQLVEAAHDKGISVYGLLAYWSSWTKPYTEQGIKDYARWARQVVRHYKGRIRHWEVWNEPNIFFWSGPKEMYADLLKQTYEAIKAEDPEAVVLGCATAGIDRAFIRQTMELGGPFDALAIHPYRGELHDLGYIDELKSAYELGGHRPLWITELGFPSHLIEGYSERNQASLVQRVYLASLLSGVVNNIAWYDFRDDGVDRFEKEQNFGLIRADLRLKPGYRSLATLGRELAGLKPGEPIDVGAGTYACRFRGADRDVVAVCAPDAGRLLTADTAAQVRVVNGVGESVEPARTGNRITFTLDRGFPVYVTGRPGFVFEPLPSIVCVAVDRSDLHAGETVILRFTPDAEVVRWQLPPGWPTPARGEQGEWRCQVPAGVPVGDWLLQAFVRHGEVMRIPIRMRVQPAVIRF